MAAPSLGDQWNCTYSDREASRQCLFKGCEKWKAGIRVLWEKLGTSPEEETKTGGKGFSYDIRKAKARPSNIAIMKRKIHGRGTWLFSLFSLSLFLFLFLSSAPSYFCLYRVLVSGVGSRQRSLTRLQHVKYYRSVSVPVAAAIVGRRFETQAPPILYI